MKAPRWKLLFLLIVLPIHYTMAQPSDFVKVPSGFLDKNEKKTYVEGFEIQKTEVTQEQFKKVTGFVPYKDPHGEYKSHPIKFTYNYPDLYLCLKNNTDPDYLYRYPTYAEWEYMARAGTQTEYSFGDDQNELPKFGYCKNHSARSPGQPVGLLNPNLWDIYDVHGNAAELATSEVHLLMNRRGYGLGYSPKLRAFGGGSHSQPNDCKSDASYDPVNNFSNVGLRLIRVPNNAPAENDNKCKSEFLANLTRGIWVDEDTWGSSSETHVKFTLIEKEPGWYAFFDSTTYLNWVSFSIKTGEGYRRDRKIELYCQGSKIQFKDERLETELNLDFKGRLHFKAVNPVTGQLILNRKLRNKLSYSLAMEVCK
ncbi:MAG: SUMF1/EgtB/PvdO family nonheme iron enzyme [Bdellovibrionaceae bacterium]|nr:SUMF1/EgtB/PvdO family nonheme iron enzyme [Pseudobdellovibrionaceae bacterium]